MRMSSFVVGGIVGAAAAIYMSRNNKPIMYSLSQAGESVNKMMDTAMNKMKVMTDKQSAGQYTDTAGGLDKVEEMAEKDPQVKQKVDEILEENTSSSFQTQ
jgi:thioredoxin reductase